MLLSSFRMVTARLSLFDVLSPFLPFLSYIVTVHSGYLCLLVPPTAAQKKMTWRNNLKSESSKGPNSTFAMQEFQHARGLLCRLPGIGRLQGLHQGARTRWGRDVITETFKERALELLGNVKYEGNSSWWEIQNACYSRGPMMDFPTGKNQLKSPNPSQW